MRKKEILKSQIFYLRAIIRFDTIRKVFSKIWFNLNVFSQVSDCLSVAAEKKAKGEYYHRREPGARRFAAISSRDKARMPRACD